MKTIVILLIMASTLFAQNIQLPLSSVNGKDYRVTFQAKEREENLIINGDFATGDGTGWILGGASTETIDYSGNEMTVTITGNGSFVARQNIIVSGETYALYYTIRDYFATFPVKALYGSGSYISINGTEAVSDTTIIAVFTASSSGYLNIGDTNAYQAGNIFTIDNVSLYKLDFESQTVHAQPIVTYGTKTSTLSALTDNWQNYKFDFTGNTSTDTLKIALSDTAKVKLDNFKLKRIDD